MVLDTLGHSLKQTLKKITQSLFVNEKLINELVKEIQRALLQSDVQVKLVFDLTKNIKDRAIGEKAPPTLTQREQLIHIVYEELVRFFGEQKHGIAPGRKKPFVIMVLGLFGSGKTTTLGKLAHYYSKRGHKVAMLGLDVYRPAAPLQLLQLSQKVGVDCYIDEKEKKPLAIWKKFSPRFHEYDLLLVDTAGRDALSTDLIKELESLAKTINPDERLLVLSADIGQAALSQAEQFHKSCGVTGVIVTKLDGTAKGGGALSACAATGAPIVFLGTGEKLDDLESFNPSGFVGRLLGMGDLEALLEKAKEVLPEKDAEEAGKRLLKGDFSLLDLYDQLSAMRKMGPLAKVMEMIPGFGSVKLPKEMLASQEGKLDTWKYVLSSCTQEELENPDIISKTRIERIAKGSGTTIKDVRDLLKQYHQSKKLMRMMKGKKPEALMKKFSKMTG